MNFWLLFSRGYQVNVEINSKQARAALEATNLEEDETLLPLDVKNVYNDAPVEGANEIALREMLSSDVVAEFPRSAMKILLRLAVTNVHFYCNETWYTQSDVLAMCALLAVILANLCSKLFGKFL